MANVNPEIWGAPSSWVYNNMSYGLETTVAKLANADKPKCKDFGSTSYDDYQQTLFSAVQHNFIALNTPLDRSLCPCGIAPEVSPWAKLAIFNESNDLSTTPSQTIEINNANTNWFFCNRRGADNNAFYYTRDYTHSNYGGLKYQQFAPKAATESTINNQCLRIAPYMSYGIKSLLLSIQVRCIAHNASNPIIDTTWRSLDDWKNNYSTYDICGLRFFVRNCTAIDNTTLALTYNNDIEQSGGYKSGNIAVFQTIKVLNNGENVDTEFLTLSMSDTAANRTGTIFDVSPMIYSWSDSRDNRPVYPCWNYFTGQTMNVYKPTSDPIAYYFYKIPYSDDTYDKIMKIAACFGCFFTPTNKYQFDYDMLDNDVYLTVLDDGGVAHGRYTHGADNANNGLYSKGSIRDIDYNPDAPPTPIDTNTYSVTTGFNTVGNVASTTKAYVVNAEALTGLSGEMWNIINSLVTKPDDMGNLDNLTLDAFLTNNPIDAIVSVKKFPLSSVPHAESVENIYLGKYQTGAAGYALAMQQARYNFEGIPIFPKFGNCFLDYAPYTKMQLYVPFCGTIEIDAADFMGRTLSVEMVIDFITGAVTAYVLANQLVVTSLTGNCGIDIAITGTEQSTVSAALENAILQDKSARGSYALKGSVGGMLTNPIGNLTHPTTAIENRFSTKLQTMQANYNLQHVEIPLRQIGQASPLNSWALEFVCRLIIYYPDGECITFNDTNEPSLITDKVESFGAVNGFATVETDTLSRFTGFTQVSDADLSGISATDTEKEMILSLLQSGVYL